MYRQIEVSTVLQITVYKYCIYICVCVQKYDAKSV